MYSNAFLAGVFVVATGGAIAHEHGTAHSHHAAPGKTTTAFGESAGSRKPSRTVQVELSDRMRYDPAELTVKRGETVRFVLRNTGKVMHEFVLGTMDDLKAHAEAMRKHPGMEHEDPYMVHVAAGKRGTLTWRFTQAGEFHYGCLIPGHFEAGMVGRITVK